MISRRAFRTLSVAALCLVTAGSCAAQDRSGKLEPIKTVRIEAGHLVVNGRPFIPLGSWAQDVKRLPMLRGLGFNTFEGNFARKPPAREFCDIAWAAGGYAAPNADPAAKGHPALLAHIQEDEPDLGMNQGKAPKMTVEEILEVYRKMKADDPDRPVWIGFTAMFMTNSPVSNKITQQQRDVYYTEAVKAGDLIGFDIYPVYGWNRPEMLTWVADGVTQLRAYAGPGRVVSCAIETARGSQWVSYEKQYEVLPMHTRAEVWMALIRGARGITYFTHVWKPEFREFAPDAAMQAELKRLNNQVTRLTPAICAEPADVEVTMKLGADMACHFFATRHEGTLYIFAQNIAMPAAAVKPMPKYPGGTATISVEGLKAGTKIEVIDEDRAITAGDGAFTDEFEGLAEHVYRIAP